MALRVTQGPTLLLVSNAATITGITAATISGGFSLVQVAHIRRAGSTAGLSAASWLLLALTFGAWLSWGVLAADWTLIATNSISLGGAIWVLASIHRDQRIPPRQVAAAVLAIGAAFSLQLGGGAVGSIIAVLTITTVIRSKQAQTLRHASDVTAVALGPWIISSAAQVVWFAHGLLADKIVIAVHAPVAIVTNLLLVAAVLRRRRQLRATPDAAPR